MSNVSLSIAFLLGSPEISGGTNVIFEHGVRLQKLGHRVTIVTESEIASHRYSWHPTAIQLNWLTIEKASDAKFDIVIATWWQSPFLLHKLSASHYVYFVQSIESRFFEEEDPTHHDKRDLSIWRDYCESSYSFNLPVITEAKWIQDYLYKNYNNSAWLVRNGIQKDIYQDKSQVISPRKEGRLRVLVEGPVDVFYKNVPKAIELALQAGVDEIWLLTSSEIEKFPGVDRVFSRIPINDTPAIYRSCDVLVKLSYIEGMFGPPLEMFHCGGTAIVYDVTGHDEYIVNGENSYVVARDDDEQVVRYLVELKENSESLKRLKRGSLATAQKWPDWQVSSEKFGQSLLEISRQPETNSDYLVNWTQKLQNDLDVRVAVRKANQFIERESGITSGCVKNGNFFQLYYWNEQEGIRADNFQWLQYIGGKPVTARFEVTVSGFPFWLRIDPSVRIGVININFIEIINERTGKKIYSCSTPEEFGQLYVAGTLHLFKGRGMNTYLSYGDDPQIILPAVTRGKVGDRLLIAVSVEESSVVQFVQGNCFSGAPIYTRIRELVTGFRESQLGRYARRVKDILLRKK